MADKTVKCRLCLGDHWTLKCPYKDTGIVGGKLVEQEKKAAQPAVDPKADLGESFFKFYNIVSYFILFTIINQNIFTVI